MNLFPFTLRCDRDTGHSESVFHNAFHKVRPEKMSWYGFDVIVRSPTEVTFVLYDIHDSFHGGLGREITRLETTMDASITRPFIVRRAIAAGASIRLQELEVIEAEYVARYADHLLNGIEQ